MNTLLLAKYSIPEPPPPVPEADPPVPMTTLYAIFAKNVIVPEANPPPPPLLPEDPPAAPQIITFAVNVVFGVILYVAPVVNVITPPTFAKFTTVQLVPGYAGVILNSTLDGIFFLLDTPILVALEN
jgi:hypothetical protein